MTSPAELTIPEIDPMATAFYARADYHAVLRTLREYAPVHHFAPGLATVARYEDIREVSRDPKRFKSGAGALVQDPIRNGTSRGGPPSILFMDPPQHRDHRQLANREFTPRAVGRMEERTVDRGGAENLRLDRDQSEQREAERENGFHGVRRRKLGHNGMGKVSQNVTPTV